MAVFAVYIQSDPFACPVLADVLRFSRAALATQHQIDHIFLYQQAVQAICPAPDLPTDETDLALALAEFCEQQQIPLLYCATAAEKRGFSQARQGYTQAGLAEFAIRLAQVDRMVQF